MGFLKKFFFLVLFLGLVSPSLCEEGKREEERGGNEPGEREEGEEGGNEEKRGALEIFKKYRLPKCFG
uniref:Antimicrobial peptide prasin b-Pul n=1 Tax=Boana pulchella TaxID=280005 RepID=A0A977QL99_9NEOB|nr:antimicrobial peptide prasin b-Pul [Boana pulchella]